MENTGLLLAFLLIIGGLFSLMIMLIRWALRVNDIVNRLDKIVELLKK